jgi:hypothetical protein
MFVDAVFPNDVLQQRYKTFVLETRSAILKVKLNSTNQQFYGTKEINC